MIFFSWLRRRRPRQGRLLPVLRAKGWLLSVLILVLYCIFGTVVFLFLEPDWTFLTALYFCITTVSTVGYGCISPSSYGSRVFTMFYVRMRPGP